MLRRRTDLWRLALFTSLGLCPNACGGQADGDVNEWGPVTREGSSTAVGTTEGGVSTTSETVSSASEATGSASPNPPASVDGSAEAELSTCVELLRAGVDTGLLRCADGVVHRPTAAHLCQSFLPRPAPDFSLPEDAGLSGEEGDECRSDTDCTDQPHGYCNYPQAGAWPFKRCHYGCVSDADCATGEFCLCGAPVGQCQPATCREDADCAPGMKCAEWVHPHGVGCPVTRSWSCQTPDDECATDADCAQGSAMANLSHFCSGAGGVRQCETIPAIACGRPFLVAGNERQASLIMSDAWTSPDRHERKEVVAEDGREASFASINALSQAQRLSLGRRWAELGLMEHASIAAFARFTLQLLHLGAPAQLVEGAQRAMADETQHARICFALASRYLGHPVGPSALPMDQALQETTLEDIVRLTVREGCIGETCAALEVAEAFEATREVQAKAALQKIRVDEFRHSQLAWQFVSWALTQGAPNAEARTRLRNVVAAEFTAVACEVNVPSPAPVEVSNFDSMEFGIVPEALLPEIRRAALRDVVLPCARELLRSVEPERMAEPTASSSTV